LTRLRAAARVVVGVVIWSACLLAGLRSASLLGDDSVLRATATSVWAYLVTPTQNFQAEAAAEIFVEAGDPVFLHFADQPAKLVGSVRSVDRISVPGSAKVSIELTGNDVSGPLSIQELVAHVTDRSGQGVLRTLLPAEKQKQLLSELATAWASRKDQTLRVITPALKQMMDDLYPVIESELEKSIVRHKDQFAEIVERHRRDYWSDEFASLASQVAWPIVRTKAQPVFDDMAGEIFQRVSVWRLGWRYLVDKVGVGNGALEAEWSRIIAEDALPIVESHMPQLADVATSVLAESAADPRVQETLRLAVHRFIQDAAVQELAGKILREAIMDNPSVSEAVSHTLDRPAVKEAWSQLAGEWEPVMVSLVERIVSGPEGEISPELARVLRSSLLGKDLRWLVIKDGPRPSLAPIAIVSANEPAFYPLPTRQRSRP
jgi:hypothetical protein